MTMVQWLAAHPPGASVEYLHEGADGARHRLVVVRIPGGMLCCWPDDCRCLEFREGDVTHDWSETLVALGWMAHGSFGPTEGSRWMAQLRSVFTG